MKEMKSKIRALFAIWVFELIFFVPTTSVVIILTYFGVAENIIIGMIILTLVFHYIIMTKTYGDRLSKKIDNLFGVKTLSSTYELRITPPK